MDWANWSTARKILIPTSLLLLIDSFFHWQEACASAGGFKVCGHQSMWHGIGLLVGILLLILIVWELLDAFSPDTVSGLNVPGGMLVLGLAGAIAILTVIRVLTLDYRHWPAWLGLILAVIIGYAGWMRYQESGDTLPSRASMGGGGTTAASTPPPAPPPPPAADAGGGMGGSGGMGDSGGMGTPPDEERPPA